MPHSRRRLLQISAGALGVTLPAFLRAKSHAAASVLEPATGTASSCIVLYCWGGMSHFESWDPKPHAPKEIRGEFSPIATATAGVHVSEHIPHLARQTDKLAIVRSMHHRCPAHGKAMYWNMTGHPPPQPDLAVNLPPERTDRPSLGAMISQFKPGGNGVPPAMRLPYPMVDNGTLQAGEYGGWLGVAADPIVVRTPGGAPFGGVSRDLGSPVLNLSEGVDRARLDARHNLLTQLEPVSAASPTIKPFEHFRDLAFDMLLSDKVKQAFELEREPQDVRDMYGPHICGRSILLSRRLVEAGVPIVTVCCAAGDLNGSAGDHWDTHGDNFNRLKNTMLPTFDRPAAALLEDLADRGRLDDTLIVLLTEFGRTPKINAAAGRDHYPHAYSVALAGGGIKGGRVYGTSDKQGAHPEKQPAGPADLHATIFKSLGVPQNATLKDRQGRPHALTDGRPLDLF